MRRTGRRLELRRETLRRLANGELGQVAGGHLTICTYERSGCREPESGRCDQLTENCPDGNCDA